MRNCVKFGIYTHKSQKKHHGFARVENFNYRSWYYREQIMFLFSTTAMIRDQTFQQTHLNIRVTHLQYFISVLCTVYSVVCTRTWCTFFILQCVVCTFLSVYRGLLVCSVQCIWQLVYFLLCMYYSVQCLVCCVLLFSVYCVPLMYCVLYVVCVQQKFVNLHLCADVRVVCIV